MLRAKYAADDRAELARKWALDEITGNSGKFWGLSDKVVIWHGTRRPVYWAFVPDKAGVVRFVTADSSTLIMKAIANARGRHD